MSSYITPHSKCGVMMCEDRQEVARSALIKGIESKMATLIWHTMPGYLQWILSSALHVSVYAPPIDHDSLPLGQVLKAVVMHLAIQYSLNLILFLTTNESWGWWWCRPLARDGIRICKGQLDHKKDWVEAVEVGGRRARQYAPWPTQASTTKVPKHQ
jgi:hypothetical protein